MLYLSAWRHYQHVYSIPLFNIAYQLWRYKLILLQRCLVGQAYAWHNDIITYIHVGTFGLRVDVTQTGDVLFEISLPTSLSTPIMLTMEYVDLDDIFRRKKVTTTVSYIATTSLKFLHLESSSRVPFDRFQVSVRLRSKLKDGPVVQDINDHG